MQCEFCVGLRACVCELNSIYLFVFHFFRRSHAYRRLFTNGHVSSSAIGFITVSTKKKQKFNFLHFCVQVRARTTSRSTKISTKLYCIYFLRLIERVSVAASMNTFTSSSLFFSWLLVDYHFILMYIEINFINLYRRIVFVVIVDLVLRGYCCSAMRTYHL